MMVKVVCTAIATGVFSSRTRPARKVEDDVAFRCKRSGNFPQHGGRICEFRPAGICKDFKKLFQVDHPGAGDARCVRLVSAGDRRDESAGESEPAQGDDLWSELWERDPVTEGRDRTVVEAGALQQHGEVTRALRQRLATRHELPEELRRREDKLAADTGSSQAAAGETAHRAEFDDERWPKP